MPKQNGVNYTTRELIDSIRLEMHAGFGRIEGRLESLEKVRLAEDAVAVYKKNAEMNRRWLVGATLGVLVNVVLAAWRVFTT